MSADWPRSSCCQQPLTPKARFCSKCGAALSTDQRAQAAALTLPERPAIDPLKCFACGHALVLNEVLKPVYRFQSGDIDDGPPASSQSHVGAEGAGGWLSNTHALSDYIRSRNLTPLDRQKLLMDKVVEAYERVGRIEAAAMPHRPGYIAKGCLVLDCPHCGASDPAHLERDAQAGAEVVRRLPR